MIFQILEAMLAVIGFVSLVLACALWVAGDVKNQVEVARDPYRAGLDASARITAAGWAAERELFRAALAAQSAKREEC